MKLVVLLHRRSRLRVRPHMGRELKLLVFMFDRLGRRVRPHTGDVSCSAGSGVGKSTLMGVRPHPGA